MTDFPPEIWYHVSEYVPIGMNTLLVCQGLTSAMLSERKLLSILRDYLRQTPWWAKHQYTWERKIQPHATTIEWLRAFSGSHRMFDEFREGPPRVLDGFNYGITTIYMHHRGMIHVHQFMLALHTLSGMWMRTYKTTAKCIRVGNAGYAAYDTTVSYCMKGISARPCMLGLDHKGNAYTFESGLVPLGTSSIRIAEYTLHNSVHFFRYLKSLRRGGTPISNHDKEALQRETGMPTFRGALRVAVLRQYPELRSIEQYLWSD